MAVSRGAQVGGGIAGGIGLLVSLVFATVGGSSADNRHAAERTRVNRLETNRADVAAEIRMLAEIRASARRGDDPRNVIALCDAYLSHEHWEDVTAVRRIRSDQQRRLPLDVPFELLTLDLSTRPADEARRWRDLLADRQMRFDLRLELVSTTSPARLDVLVTPRSRDRVTVAGDRVSLGWTAAGATVPGTDQLATDDWQLVATLRAVPPGSVTPVATLETVFAVPDTWRGPPLVRVLDGSDPPGHALRFGAPADQG